MGKFTVVIEKEAKRDFEKIYKSGQKSSIKKLEAIILELSIHPTIGIGNPEPLKHELFGYWSRRINKKDRLIYEIIEEPKIWLLLFLLLDITNNLNFQQK